jgi:hypothetical protein
LVLEPVQAGFHSWYSYHKGRWIQDCGLDPDQYLRRKGWHWEAPSFGRKEKLPEYCVTLAHHAR